jgi:Spy/CpxP family protein refolding chaperone
MRKTFAVAAMLLTMAGAASAQGGGGGGGGGRMQMSPEQRDSSSYSRMFDGITVSADAKPKAMAIIKAAREATAGMDRQAPDFRDKMTAANAKRNTDLKALLGSDADRTKFDDNASKMGGRGRGGQ